MSTEGKQEGGALASWATGPHFGPKRWAEASGLPGASKEAETHRHQSPMPARLEPSQGAALQCNGNAGPGVHLRATTSTMAMPTRSTQGRAGLMRTAKLSRDSRDETAGTRQPLILPMSFTNVIFRLNYFKHCTESPGDSVHSTSISPQQIHSLSTARCTALPVKEFYHFSQSETPKIHTNHTLTISPAHLPPHCIGWDTINQH